MGRALKAAGFPEGAGWRAGIAGASQFDPAPKVEAVRKGLATLKLESTLMKLVNQDGLDVVMSLRELAKMAGVSHETVRRFRQSTKNQKFKNAHA